MTNVAASETPRLCDTALVSLYCLAGLIATTGVHFEALRLVKAVVSRLDLRGRTLPLFVMLALFVAHAAEVLLYAATYYVLAMRGGPGTLGAAGPPSFSGSLYFSFETYSSLGYGDIVPSGCLRMLAGTEALNGLLLIGWSACYVYAMTERLTVGGETPLALPAFPRYGNLLRRREERWAGRLAQRRHRKVSSDKG